MAPREDADYAEGKETARYRKEKTARYRKGRFSGPWTWSDAGSRGATMAPRDPGERLLERGPFRGPDY